MPELADHWVTEFHGQIQGSLWWSFGALRFALHPHHVIVVDEQVLVERFKAKSMIGLEVPRPSLSDPEVVEQLEVGVLTLQPEHLRVGWRQGVDLSRAGRS